MFLALVSVMVAIGVAFRYAIQYAIKQLLLLDVFRLIWINIYTKQRLAGIL